MEEDVISTPSVSAANKNNALSLGCYQSTLDFTLVVALGLEVLTLLIPRLLLSINTSEMVYHSG